MLRKLVNLAARLAQYRDYRYFGTFRPEFAATSRKTPLIVSIDVEASPNYPSCDHAGELIWGRFGKEQIGITRMMDLAEKYGHRLTFFVDYCERFLYPDHFREITGAIQSRGHDLTDITANVLIEMRGVPRDWRPDLLPSDTDLVGLKWEVVDQGPINVRGYDPGELLGARQDYEKAGKERHFRYAWLVL
jgi:hypothetical protein